MVHNQDLLIECLSKKISVKVLSVGPYKNRTRWHLFLIIFYFNHLSARRFQQDPHVSFVVKAVSALTAAFRLVQLDHCTQSLSAACLRQVHSGLHEDILHNLKKLSFTSVPGSPMEVEGTQHHFTRNGRLVANKQLVFQIDQLEGMAPVSYCLQ